MKKLFILIAVFTLVFTLSSCTDELQGLITDAEETIATLETDIEAILGDIDSVEEQIAALGTTDGDVEEDITDIKADIMTIRSDIVVIETKLSELDDTNDNLAALELEVEELEASLLALEAMLEEYMMPHTVDDWKALTQTKIAIMYNNDVHGRVNPDGWAGSIGFAQIKNYIDVVRTEYEHSFLVSAGDMFHGTTFATLEQGESFVEVMNAVGYDLMVPGNHDFDYGQDQLLVLEGMATFPIISSNIQYDADDTDMFDTTFIQEFGDVTVGFFGLTTPDTTYMTHPDNVIGLNFLDPILQAEAMVTYLEGEDVDVIVMLGHIGLDESSSVTSEDIASEVDGIDVIIDGHSHSYLPQGFMVNDTLIVSASEYNKNFGVLELVVEDGEVVEYTNLLVNQDEMDLFGYGEDEEVAAVIEAIEVDQEVILNVVVGQTGVVLDGERADVRTGETNLGMIITDAMIDVTGADIAITNGGGIRASIDAGDVTIGDIITVLPFGNIIVTLDLTGQEIIDTLEYATSSAPDASGKFPHVAGLTYTLDLNAAEGSRVTNVMIDGVAIDIHATYSVATNDFLAAGGDGYDLFAAATITGEFMGLHEALEAAFTVGVDIVIPTDTRLTIIEVTP